METIGTDPGRARKIDVVSYDPVWLRVSAEELGLYARTKQDLAMRDWAHVQDYANAKQSVIAKTLARAEAWHGRSGR
jgi:hypothetical protein